jgi:hypothetical protein
VVAAVTRSIGSTRGCTAEQLTAAAIATEFGRLPLSLSRPDFAGRVTV